MTIFFRLLILLATPLLLGQTPKPAAKSAVRTTPDSVIQQRIQWRFAKSKIHADRFQVKVENGVAILTGSTNVIQRKGTATRLAKLAGARGVQNQIQISDAARAKAMANLQKARLKSAAK
jgi:osmotically-inducible protein OsmY